MRSNEYKWHDLQKNPSDLPYDGQEVLIAIDLGIYYIATYSSKLKEVDEYDFTDEDGDGFYEYDSEWGYFKFNDVVAWKYIEPFTII